MTLYYKMFYNGDRDSSNMIKDQITSEKSTATLDVKLFMRLHEATIAELQDIKEKSACCRNAFLLEGEIMRAFSFKYASQGNMDKALQYMHQSRSICLEAAPSHFTSIVYYIDACNLIRFNKSNITPEIKQRILKLFDWSITDSYYCVGWERFLIFLAHVKKALFCLSGAIDFLNIPSTQSYCPTSEDISLAEQHLKAAPLDEVNDIQALAIIYNIAMSDLFQWKEDKQQSQEYAEKAKTLCTENRYYTSSLVKAIDARLELLGHDTMDELLEEFQDVQVHSRRTV